MFRYSLLEAQGRLAAKARAAVSVRKSSKEECRMAEVGLSRAPRTEIVRRASTHKLKSFQLLVHYSLASILDARWFLTRGLCRLSSEVRNLGR